MIRKHALVLMMVISVCAHGQALRDINFNYLYNPAQTFSFLMKPVRHADGWKTYYQLTTKDTTQKFAISWEIRTALSDKEGAFVLSSDVKEETRPGKIQGIVTTGTSAIVQILAAKIVNTTARQAWYYFVFLEPNYPLNLNLSEGSEPITQPYISVRQKVSIEGISGPLIVSLYRDFFPAGAPAFSEGQARVSQTIKTDSVFTVNGGESYNFSIPGMYLVQHDTTTAEGITFRVGDDYPRFSKVESLADPLIYICTKQEFDRIKAAKGDKKVFDRVILGITGDTDRARDLMRSYFRRVELANQYFTSYKEGWKTDRGMIYIIFGMPDKVYRFADREVWSYDNAIMKNTFNFARSASLFDPDNFVLVREKKYQDSWYEVIDLWRNARF